MKTSLRTGFAQIFSCCPKKAKLPKIWGVGAAAPLAPRLPGPYAYGYRNSLLLLSRLTRVTKKLQKRSLWIWNWISHQNCRKVSWQWLVTRVAWATGLVNSWKQFHVLIKSTMENWIRLRVLSCCLKITSPRISSLSATEFWLICSLNKSFIRMWVYHLWQNEWLFW